MLRITEFRKRKNLSQDALANLTKISARMISDYEKGNKDIPLKKLQLIATALDCTLNELIGDSGVVQAKSATLDTNGTVSAEPLDRSDILNKIKEYYGFSKESDFADFLNISPQVLSNWNSRHTFDIEKVYKRCPEINAHWLISGTGSMLNSIHIDKSPDAITLLQEQVSELRKDKILLASIIESKL